MSAPEPLTVDHLLDAFACGSSALDDWLKRRAMANHLAGACRTFVVADEEKRVLGYYGLAAGAVSHSMAPGAIRRNMPDPIPVMVLARLAVDRQVQGMKFGSGMLQDAVKRTVMVAEHAGVRALLVHALDEQAKQFYRHYGFVDSPVQPMTLMLRL